MQQVCLFDALEEKKPTPAPTFSEPVPHGKHMSIHGLLYDLKPVESWVEVKSLCIEIFPERKKIAVQAWVHPDTIAIAICQDYKPLNQRFKKEGKGYQLTPIAWGFGPEVKVSRHKHEGAVFDFANYEDYLRVEEKFLKPKREEHNRNFVKEVPHGNHSRAIESPEPYSGLGAGKWPGGNTRRPDDHPP